MQDRSRSTAETILYDAIDEYITRAGIIPVSKNSPSISNKISKISYMEIFNSLSSDAKAEVNRMALANAERMVRSHFDVFSERMVSVIQDFYTDTLWPEPAKPVH